MRKVFYTSLSMFTHYCSLWLREHELLPIYRCCLHKWAHLKSLLRTMGASWEWSGNSSFWWLMDTYPCIIHVKGQSKLTRIRNKIDWLEPSEHRQKYSRCGTEGHNRRRCPMQSKRGSCSFNWFMYVRQVASNIWDKWLVLLEVLLNVFSLCSSMKSLVTLFILVCVLQFVFNIIYYYILVRNINCIH